MTTTIGFVAVFCALVGLSTEQHISCNSTVTARIRVGIGVYPTELSGVTGSQLTLICEVMVPNVDDTINSFAWEFNRQIQGVFSEEDRPFRPVTSGDGGEYRCRALVTINKGLVCETRYSTAVTINTQPLVTSITPASPLRVVEGEAIRLTCDAEGHPPPSYEWFRTDTPTTILSRDAVYTLQALSMSDSGVYVCRASNTQGSHTRDVSVTVTTPPPPVTTSALTEPDTTTASPTTQDNASDGTQETAPTPSPVSFYIGVAVIAVVVVLITLLTVLCFVVGICFSRTKAVPKFGSEELIIQDDHSGMEAVDDEEPAEEPVFEEMVQENEVIPRPKKKKTRGKRPKF